jgi:hypothetical protein
MEDQVCPTPTPPQSKSQPSSAFSLMVPMNKPLKLGVTVEDKTGLNHPGNRDVKLPASNGLLPRLCE